MANPYHDKEGKFTSKGNQGSAEPKPKGGKIVNKLKLKYGVDLSNFPKPQDISTQLVKPVQNATGVIDTSFELTMPTSIQDAEAQGNKILGVSNVVFYASDTNLEQTFEMNKALKVVVNDFKDLFKNNLLLSYGTRDLPNQVKMELNSQKTIEVLRKAYSNPAYDEFKREINNTNGNFDIIISAAISILGFSGITKRMDEFSTKKGVQGCTMSFHYYLPHYKSPSSVQFNQNYMKHDIAMSVRKTMPAVLTGHSLSWGDKTPTFSTCTHELGHHCFNQMSFIMTKEERDELKKLLVIHNPNEVSGYGQTNNGEQIAEAFSDYYCRGNGATNHNKKIVKFLKGVYDRVFGTQKV